MMTKDSDELVAKIKALQVKILKITAAAGVIVCAAVQSVGQNPKISEFFCRMNSTKLMKLPRLPWTSVVLKLNWKR
jgi:hypothetical protein